MVLKITDFDLQDQNHQEILLKSGKATRLEGLVAENWFVENMCGSLEISLGWWVFKKDDEYRAIHFTSSYPKENDFKVADVFVEQGISVHFMVYDIDFKISAYTKGGKLNLSVFRPRKDYYTPPEGSVDHSRMDKAYNWLHSKGLIKEAAIAQAFASFKLNAKKVWDLDAVAIVDGKVKILEVKHKYAGGGFGSFYGINSGALKMFTFFKARGIDTVHVIFNKPVKNGVSNVDFFENDELAEKSKIKVTVIDPAKYSYSSWAPEYTSIGGKGKVEYYKIDTVYFKTIGTLSNPDLNKFEKIVKL